MNVNPLKIAVLRSFIRLPSRSFARMGGTTSQYVKNTLMPDGYTVSPPLPVPEEIIRPRYVGQDPQVFPNIMTDPIYKIEDPEQIEGLKIAAKLASKALKAALDFTKEGVSLDEIDQVVHQTIVDEGGYPSAIDFHHFPKSVCTSVNDVVSHGVPNNYVLRDGDWINIDVVCFKEGCHGDNSGMVLVGDVHPEVERLSRVTREAMFKAIQICKPGTKFNEIGETIENYAHKHGFAVNREFGGHGICHEMHMAPLVYHYKTPSSSRVQMEPGMAFTIEPILMLHDQYQYIQWQDGWTVQAPGVPSCQWEHIILITDDGHEILTLREGEELPF